MMRGSELPQSNFGDMLGLLQQNMPVLNPDLGVVARKSEF